MTILSRYAQPVGLLVASTVFMLVWVPDLAMQSLTFATFENIPLLGLVSLGLATTMIAGELDLSVGSMAALAAVIAMKVSGGGLVVCVVVPMLICGAIGLVQGYIIGRFGVSSVMLTIGSLIGLSGLTYVVASNTTVTIENLNISDLLLRRWYTVFSPSSVIALAAFALVGLFLAVLRPGRHVYSIGGARVEARAAGISTARTMAVAFMVSAMCAALAGSLAAVRGGSAAPGAYSTLLLPAVAAALIGGVGVAGGRGTALNALLGTLVLGVIGSALTIRGSTPDVTQIVTGAILLVVLMLEFGGKYLQSLRPRRRLTTGAPAGAPG